MTAASYVGRRTVLVVGGDIEDAGAIGGPLVAAGVEVHVIAGDGGLGRLAGVASWNACDLASADAVDAAMRRIGAVVQHVFHTSAHAAPFEAVALAALPLMTVGGSIVGIAAHDDARDGALAAFVEARTDEFAAAGVLLTATARVEDALAAGLA